MQLNIIFSACRCSMNPVSQHVLHHVFLFASTYPKQDSIYKLRSTCLFTCHGWVCLPAIAGHWGAGHRKWALLPRFSRLKREEKLQGFSASRRGFSFFGPRVFFLAGSHCGIFFSPGPTKSRLPYGFGGSLVSFLGGHRL